MDKEEFLITVDGIHYTIRTALPPGPDPVDHEVWHNNNLLFIINPNLNESDEPRWKLTAHYAGADIDAAFVQRVGLEIEKHYL